MGIIGALAVIWLIYSIIKEQYEIMFLVMYDQKKGEDLKPEKVEAVA